MTAAATPLDGFVFLGLPDVNGKLRGKGLAAAEFAAVMRRGHASYPDLLLALDPADEPIAVHAEIGPSSGAGDLRVVPVPETVHPLTWRRGWRVCLGDVLWSDGEPCELAPRQLLLRLLDELAGVGLEVMAGFEYEIRLTRGDDGSPLCAPTSYSFEELSSFDALALALVPALDALGIELAGLHTEAGPGLFELNTAPRRGVRAADEALLVKTAVADVARSLGYRASFLAKSDVDYEGSGGHLHLSLWDDTGNAFADGPLLANAVGGLIAHLPAASVLLNPTINSYKRLVPGAFAPVNASWGEDNRSTAIRVVRGAPAATRIELRRPGADANPYLVLAAALAAVLLGVDGRREPPAPITGDAASDHDAADLPGSLEAALAAFAADEPFRRRLGMPFARFYEVSRRWELRAWQRAVTDWERRRYAS